jgi:hypothetical protein
MVTQIEVMRARRRLMRPRQVLDRALCGKQALAHPRSHPV